MPVLAACFPVPSPSSQGRVSRVLWQDLARVWGGKGTGKEMTTLNPWPSVLPLSALYTQDPSFAWAQRAPLAICQHHHPLEKWRPNCSEASSSTGQQAGRLEMVRARAGGGREGIPVSK